MGVPPSAQQVSSVARATLQQVPSLPCVAWWGALWAAAISCCTPWMSNCVADAAGDWCNLP